MPTLDWVGRGNALAAASSIPYRLLKEDRALSYGDAGTKNLIVHGDNLDSLKALSPYYAGRVKCVYIDPPYNTRSAFGDYYDDAIEHSEWLRMMFPRLVLLRDLLAEDGSLWISIDDNENHYLKVIADEVFGRRNFITSITWQKKVSPANDAMYFSGDHEYLLVYAKNAAVWRPNRLPHDESQLKNYTNPDNDERGDWNSGAYTCAKNADERPNLYYPVTQPNTGEPIWPKRTRVWAYGPEAHAENVAKGLVYWGKDGLSKVPRYKRFKGTGRLVVPRSVWSYEVAGHTQEAMLESLALFGEAPFPTPKPERLISRIFTVATQPGDIVLDSFLGSGTSAAVAHKMERNYIGVEMGEHARSHCSVRLKAVVDGEQGGISKKTAWEGGGGFRFYSLGDAILDEYGCVKGDVKFDDLAALLWMLETGQGLPDASPSPFIGEWCGVGYYLLFNGILGDKRPGGGNVLNNKTLTALPPYSGPKIVFAEATLLGQARLDSAKITFKQIPHGVRIG